jgi:uncharacterized peroxidase-related enzyme
LLKLTHILTLAEPFDVVKTLTYRPEYFGRHFCDLGHELLRGPSEWTIGERELFGAFTSSLNRCLFWTKAHRAVAWSLLGHELTGEVFADWRKAQIDLRLRATLGLLEKVTLSPREIGSHDLAKLREAGLTDRAILDATYVCAGFNIIARIADALGFKIPSEELFARAAKLLVIFGYRRLSGFWTDGVNNRSADPMLISSSIVDKQPTPDRYDKKMRRLRNAVLAGPGALAPSVRQTISDGRKMSGVLGAYAKKVAEHAYLVTDDDIAELHRAHYSDDQIFEATVSAALGAGILRLECVLRALQSDELTRILSADSPFEDASVPSMTRDVALV